MKLYYSPGACSLSPHIVACEAELPLELIRVNLSNKLTETNEDFQQLTPMAMSLFYYWMTATN